MLPIIYGILSAATWGAADFLGGLGSKRTSPYRILFLAEIAGGIPFVGSPSSCVSLFLLLRICFQARDPASWGSRDSFSCTVPWRPGK